MHFNLGNGVAAELTISNSTLTISSGSVEAGVITTDIFIVPEGRAGSSKAIIGMDINFDGSNDLLVKVSDSASNPCYKPFIAVVPPYVRDHIESAPFTESAITLCNPDADTDKKEIISVERYGPFSRTEIYSMSEDNGIELSTIIEDINYNFSRISVNVSSEEGLENFISIRGARSQAFGCLIKKSDLYDSPGYDAVHGAHLVPGDRVKIEDVKRIRGDEWIEVSYQGAGREIIKAWIEQQSVEPLEAHDSPCGPTVDGADN